MFGFDRRLIVAVVAVLVVAGGVAAMTVLGGGGTTETNAQLDMVPAGSEGILYIDGNITDDEFTLDTLDGGLEVGWWFVDNSTAPEISVLTETLDTENINYQNTTVFLRGPENGQANYAGSVVNLGEGSQASDMVDLLEAELGADQLEQGSYNGVDIREVNIVEAADETDVEGVTGQLDVTGVLREFVGANTTAWVATPDEDTVILGSEQAATDAIDLYQGEGDPIDGEIRGAHEHSAAGPVEATVTPDIVDIPLTEVLGVVSPDAQALLEAASIDPQYVSLTYDVRDRERETITFDVTATMANSGDASDLYSALDAQYNPDEAIEDPSVINDSRAVERSAAEQNGKYFHIDIPTLPIQAATYVAQFVDRYGADPGPTELVPRRADGLVHVDWDVAGNRTASALVDETLAAGLVDGAEGWTAADVRSAIELDNISYESSTTFYSSESEDYVATYLRLSDMTGERFVTDNLIRGQFRERTDGAGIGFRENHKGYRHVDVHNMTALDGEVNATRVLSGFVANGSTEWMTPIGTNGVLFGNKTAVTDAIDIFRGVDNSTVTPLREAHSRADGAVVLSTNVSGQPVDEYAGVVDGDIGAAMAGQNVDVLSVGYDPAGDTGTIEAQFDAGEEGAAGDLETALDVVVDGSAEGDPGAPVADRAALRRNGSYVTLAVPYGPDQFVTDATAFDEMFGGALLPGEN